MLKISRWQNSTSLSSSSGLQILDSAPPIPFLACTYISNTQSHQPASYHGTHHMIPEPVNRTEGANICLHRLSLAQLNRPELVTTRAILAFSIQESTASARSSDTNTSPCGEHRYIHLYTETGNIYAMIYTKLALAY